MRFAPRVRRESVIIPPMGPRRAEDIASVRGAGLSRSMKPRVVNVDVELVEKLLREEHDLEKRRFERLAANDEPGT